MQIIINASSMVPIYEQIIGQIKSKIRHLELQEGDPLPSVRVLAKELGISVLTVKKAYDKLESDGFTTTIHGKGTYVSSINPELVREEQMNEIETSLEEILSKASRYGIEGDDIKNIFELLMEEY